MKGNWRRIRDRGRSGAARSQVEAREQRVLDENHPEGDTLPYIRGSVSRLKRFFLLGPDGCQVILSGQK